MSRIDEMINTTSSFLKNVDKVDIELISSNYGSDAILYAVAMGKSVSIRQQIKPKHKKSGVCEIKLKRGADVIESIYSWCGFKWLEIKLELITRATKDFKFSETTSKILRYSDVSPGWLSLPPLFSHPFMNITFSFVEQITTPPEYNHILLKTIMLYNPQRIELSRAIDPENIDCEDTARKFLALFPREEGVDHGAL